MSPDNQTTKKKRVRFLRWFVGIIGALLLLLVALPVWFPWIARPLLGHVGLRYGSYERRGMASFQLNHVSADWGASQFHADEVRCLLPTAWLWWKLSGHTNTSPALLIRHGVLLVHPRTNAPSSSATTTHSAGGTLDEIQRFGTLLKKYVPSARLTRCVIHLPGSQLLIPQASWSECKLNGQFRSTNWPALLQIDARLMNNRSLTLSLNWKRQQAALQGTFTRETNYWTWNGQLMWTTNHAKVAAQFTTNSWWPTQARLTAPQLTLPANVIRLNGYQALTTSLALDLVSNQFNLQATGFARPTRFALQRGLPPIHGSTRLTGNPEGVTLEQFHLQAPFAQATLTNALGIKRTGQLKNLAARLRLSVNFSKLPGLSMTGTASGEMRVDLETNRQPVAHFKMTSTHLGAFGLKTRSARLEGHFTWPMLALQDLSVNWDDGSTLNAKGAIDLATKKLQATHWRFEGGFLNRFLRGFHYQSLAASGTAQGPLTNLVQTGRITVSGLSGGMLQPVHAHAQWQAQGWKLNSARLQLNSGQAELTAGGSFNLAAIRQHEINGSFESLTLRRDGQTLYSLQQPCPVFFRQANTNGSPRQWQARVDHFNWLGKNSMRKISLTAWLHWPEQGSFQLNIRHAALDDFTNFVRKQTGDVNIAQLNLAGNWSNGPVRWTGNLNAMVGDHSGRSIAVQSKLDGGKALAVHQLSLRSAFTPPVSVTGTLPFQIVPSATNGWLAPNDQAVFHLEASSAIGTNSLPLPLGSLGTWEISNANFHAQASGTLAKPSVALTFAAGHLRMESRTNVVPHLRLDDLKIKGTITPNRVQLHNLAFNLDDQPVSLSGECPLPEHFWRTVWAGPKSTNWTLPDWRKATGQMHIQNAKLATLSRYAPKLLAPFGQLNVNLALQPGGQIEGSMTLTNISTQPLGQLPPVRDISAQVLLNGTQVTLRNFTGLLGEQSLHLSGQATFPIGGPLSYHVHLTGTNLPLARQPEFLMRGDVNLILQGGSNAPTSVNGQVTLRHGLYVRYLSDLLWSGPKHPALHPPYFSITNQPFAAWKLDVGIQGNHFLHVQTPVFSGVASTDAKLSGTLKAPVLTGTARLDSGQIHFPFGTLEVTHGSVDLNGNNLSGPAVEFHASGMAYNYDVHLDATGPANNLNVQFSSTPPLNSEEILLLLTAGQLPQNEYSFSTEARAGRLATFLGKEWLGRFTGNIGGHPRWIIRSGEHISEQGRLTYSVEYRLTKRWSIIGEYDQYDQYNANLKWKIISR